MRQVAVKVITKFLVGIYHHVITDVMYVLIIYLTMLLLKQTVECKMVKSEGKGKARSRTGHEGQEGALLFL